jgi:hypothetical protein
MSNIRDVFTRNHWEGFSRLLLQCFVTLIEDRPLYESQKHKPAFKLCTPFLASRCTRDADKQQFVITDVGFVFSSRHLGCRYAGYRKQRSRWIRSHRRAPQPKGYDFYRLWMSPWKTDVRAKWVPGAAR